MVTERQVKRLKKKWVNFQVEEELIKQFDEVNKYKSRSQALKDFMIETIQKNKKVKV